MASLIDNPVQPPRFDPSTWREDEDRYIKQCYEVCRDNDGHPLAGETLRWQRADGYAQYMVYRISPLTLIHLSCGDAWEVEAPLIRGLELSDVEEMVESEHRIRSLFNNRA